MRLRKILSHPPNLDDVNFDDRGNDVPYGEALQVGVVAEWTIFFTSLYASLFPRFALGYFVSAPPFHWPSFRYGPALRLTRRDEKDLGSSASCFTQAERSNCLAAFSLDAEKCSSSSSEDCIIAKTWLEVRFVPTLSSIASGIEAHACLSFG
jgi:hypothetical protein